MRSLKRSLFAALLAAACVPDIRAQTVIFPPGIVLPAGTYQVVSVGPTTIDQGVKDGRQYVTISWVAMPPSPTPTPTPTPTPGPTPTPTPPPNEFGPLARILTIYESASLTGREPMYSSVVIDALNQVAPPDQATKVPLWRNWDKDLDPTAIASSPDASWSEAWRKAKADFAAGPDPVMYAFDAQNRMKKLPLKDAKDADVAAWINGLKAVSKPRKAA
jgi:hypothetical protein